MCVSCIPDVWESMHGLAWGVPLSAEGPKPLSTPLCISSVKDKKSFLGIEEEVSENPYRYKASCVTQLLTPIRKLETVESDLVVILDRELIYS